MLNNSFDSFLYYFSHFEYIDYLAFIWIIALGILFLTLGLMLIKSNFTLGLTILLCTIIILGLSPFAIKWYLNTNLRHTYIKIDKNIKTNNELIIKGRLRNLSKRDFSTCKLFLGIYKTAYFMQPFKTMVQDINKTLPRAKVTNFKFTVSDTNITKETDFKIKADCYK
ncbi:MAG: DUF2393 family protein [Campylobacteraceae bacterium]|nr:DUF2393 family protein [Campylobacteraceae bacterium]